MEEQIKQEEPWINLSGCNTCVNSTLCAELGNCVILSVNQQLPEFNKRKRKLIQRIRSMSHDNRAARAKEFIKKALPGLDKTKVNGAKEFDENDFLDSDNPRRPILRLTRLEIMFIANLNKPR